MQKYVEANLAQYNEIVRAYREGHAFSQDLLLAKVNNLETYYAPFEYVNSEARVVICGITPGAKQAKKALKIARDALLSGENTDQAKYLAKEAASFAGPMRKNLVQLMDSVGLHKKLGLESTESLFGSRSDLVHYTSALRNPVFRNGKDYSGSPDMLRTKCLREQVDACLEPEVIRLADAIWIPLGPKVASVLGHFVSNGLLNGQRLLAGLPHPSGANMERINVFLGKKPPHEASKNTNSQVLLDNRKKLKTKVAGLAHP